MLGAGGDRAGAVRELLHRCNGSSERGQASSLTFDDGLLSSFDAVQQVLNPRGIKAMFFVPTMILDLRSADEMRDFFRRNVYRASSDALSPVRTLPTRAQVKELRRRLGRPVRHDDYLKARLPDLPDTRR